MGAVVGAAAGIVAVGVTVAAAAFTTVAGLVVRGLAVTVGGVATGRGLRVTTTAGTLVDVTGGIRDGVGVATGLVAVGSSVVVKTVRGASGPQAVRAAAARMTAARVLGCLIHALSATTDGRSRRREVTIRQRTTPAQAPYAQGCWSLRPSGFGSPGRSLSMRT